MNLERLIQNLNDEIEKTEEALEELIVTRNKALKLISKLEYINEQVENISDIMNQIQVKRQLLSFREARALLGVGSNDLSKLVKDKTIKRKKVKDGVYKFSLKDLENYIEALEYQ